LLLCVFREAAESVDQLRLLDRIAAGFKKAGRTDKISEALRARDRNVQAIAGEKKCELRGRSSPLEVANEKKTIGACWPWHLSPEIPE